MTRIDKMLHDAKLLDLRTRTYSPCVLVEMTSDGEWKVSGCNRKFETEESAVRFCQEQAAGRPVGIVICDIPRVLPESDNANVDAMDGAAALKELIDHVRKGSP